MAVRFLYPIGGALQVQMMQFNVLQVLRFDMTTERVEKRCRRSGDAMHKYIVVCAKENATLT